MRSLRSSWMVPCVALIAAGAANAAPRLEALSPVGFERGKTITLTLAGRNLGGDIEILSKIPGTLQIKPVDVVEGKPAYSVDQRRDIEIAIAAEAAVGLYPIRVRTADGISNPLTFAVGLLPDVGEVEPNNSPSEAQLIPLASTVLGSVAPADRDFYRLTLSAGSRVVAEVEARRLGLAMDSNLQIVDSQGRQIASNDDAVGLDADSRVDVVVSKAGDYFIVVNDVTYQSSSAYRLKVGDFDYADGIYPLGGPRSAETQVWPITSDGREAEPTTVPTQSSGDWTMVQPMGSDTAALPIRFVLGPGEEILESESLETPIRANQTANGRLLQAGEKDRYRLPVSPGQRWLFQVTAAALGSPLDGVLIVMNATGDVLARADDGAGLDPAVDYTVGEGITEVLLQVEDLQGRGGPAFGYRLRAELMPSADFALEVVPQIINIPVGSAEFVKVRVERRGYDGAIQLYVPEKVGGVIADGGRIEPGQTEGYLLLSAAPGAAPGKMDLEIWGRGGSAARPIDRQARGSSANAQPWIDAALVDPMPAALCQAKPLGGTITPRELNLTHGYGGQLEVKLERSPTANQDVRITPRIRIPSFPNGLEITISKDQNTGTIEFSIPAQVGMSEGLMVFDATTTAEDREVRITLPPVYVRIVRPFTIELMQSALSIPATGAGHLEIVVRRTAPFDGAVVVRIEDLQKGMAAEPVTIPPGDSSARCILKTDGCAAGAYTLKVIAAAADVPGRKRDKDYVLPPVEVPLTVTP